MYDGLACAFESLKGLFNQVRPGLGKNLYGHVSRDSVILNQVAHELIVVPGSRGKPHLDFLETQFDELIPQSRFLWCGHRLNQGLVAISQIHATPVRRFFDDTIGPPPVGHGDGLEGLVLAMIEAAHAEFPEIDT